METAQRDWDLWVTAHVFLLVIEGRDSDRKTCIVYADIVQVITSYRRAASYLVFWGKDLHCL